MAFRITAPHKIPLFTQMNDHSKYTGGWKIVEDDTTAKRYICEAPYRYSSKTPFKSLLPNDSNGSMIIAIMNSSSERTTQSVCMRSKKMIDFKNCTDLRFLFTRIINTSNDKIFGIETRIRILDKKLKPLKTFDFMKKNVYYERGVIDIKGIEKGYVEIRMKTWFVINDLGLFSRLSDGYIRTSDGEKIITTSLNYYNTEVFNKSYYLTKYGAYVTTKNNERLLIQESTNFNTYLQILNMWCE